MRIFLKEGDEIPQLASSEAIAYRLVGRPPEYEGPNRLVTSSKHLHGCRIVQQLPLPDKEAAGVRELLSNVDTYGDHMQGARCFFPGFAFTFGKSVDVVDVLVCLECRWVVFHFGSKSISLAPTDAGLEKLREVYQRVFLG